MTLQSSQFQPARSSDRWTARALVIAALLFSWAIVWHPYLLDADDYQLGDKFRAGLWGPLREYFTQFGARRLLQMAYMETVCAMPLEMINALCVAAHMAASLLFYEVSLRVLKRSGLALALALVFAASPLAFGVMIWASGSYVAVHLALFLAALLCFFSYWDRRSALRSGGWSLGGGCLLLILCLFSGDHLIPVSALMGVLVAVVNGATWQTLLSRKYRMLVLAPALTVLGFVIVAVATCPYGTGSWDTEEAGSIHYDRFNPRAFVSVWFYLHRILDSLEPWGHPGAAQVAFSDWRFWHVVILGAIFALMSWLLWRALKTKKQDPGVPPFGVGPVLGAMMIAVAAVHALHGGYSGSMRYQYVPFVFALWAVGWILSLQPFRGCLRPPPVLAFVAGLAMLLLSAATCWLDLGISRFELRRYDAVVKAVAGDATVTDVRLAFEPAPYHYWPKLLRVRSHGLQEDWAINYALNSLGHESVQFSAGPSSSLVTVTASPDGKVQAILAPPDQPVVQRQD